MTLPAEDVEFVAALVRKHAAIVLDASKGYLVEARLASLRKRTGHQTAEEIVAELRRSPWGDLHGQVVEVLTTNETSFFRDFHPWENLADHVLPELIEARRNHRTLRIWCGASSSGQEPYTLAMVLRERFPVLRDWSVSIICTDISKRMVERTQEGRYSDMEINRGLDVNRRKRWFTQDGTHWTAVPELRSLISARACNLAVPWPAITSVDLVVLRNVLIYFDVEDTKSILERIAHLLPPDGYLLLGAAETTLNITDAYSRVVFGNTSFYRPAGTAPTPRPLLTIGASS